MTKGLRRHQIASGRVEERAQHPYSLLSLPSKDGGHGRQSLSPGAGPLGPHGCL